MTATKLRRSRARRGEGDRLREEILEATEALLIKTSDCDALSVRTIADAVGVTPPSIYMHFATKEELVFEVCERQYRALDAYAEQAVAGIDDPVEALKAMGRAYVRFGTTHPEQYRFLFVWKRPEAYADYLRERIEELSGFWKLVAAVQRCIDTGAFERGDAFTIACGLWSGVHGITSFLISKDFFPWPKDLAEHCLDTMCKGLSA